jgi:molybdopterin converting factor small subunit
MTSAATPDETGSPAGSAEGLEATGGTAAGAPLVTIRYWAAARAAAGVSEEQVHGETLAAALSEALAAHPELPRFEQVLSICSFLVGETPVGKLDPALVPLAAGDEIEVLPPFAGG